MQRIWDRLVERTASARKGRTFLWLSEDRHLALPRNLL